VDKGRAGVNARAAAMIITNNIQEGWAAPAWARAAALPAGMHARQCCRRLLWRLHGRST
jgi:predicted DCC family thiol-disulfide oxidoreductase YuxK